MTSINQILFYTINLIAPQMRAPGVGIAGWLAMKIMDRGNPPSIREGIRRLQLQSTDTFVELGAGHGVGVRAAYAASPRRIVAVEISEAFQEKLEAVKLELEQESSSSNGGGSDTCPSIEVYGQDAKDMKAFLEDGSVDKMFAMNVVYFLDPLDVYLDEIDRVLKPGGSVTFGFKSSVKDMRPPFINTNVESIVEKMKTVGFDVTSSKVDLEDPIYNYIEIKGVKTIVKITE